MAQRKVEAWLLGVLGLKASKVSKEESGVFLEKSRVLLRVGARRHPNYRIVRCTRDLAEQSEYPGYEDIRARVRGY